MPYCSRDPKRDHDFDNRPMVSLRRPLKRQVSDTLAASEIFISDPSSSQHSLSLSVTAGSKLDDDAPQSTESQTPL